MKLRKSMEDLVKTYALYRIEFSLFSFETRTPIWNFFAKNVADCSTFYSIMFRLLFKNMDRRTALLFKNSNDGLVEIGIVRYHFVHFECQDETWFSCKVPSNLFLFFLGFDIDIDIGTLLTNAPKDIIMAYMIEKRNAFSRIILDNLLVTVTLPLVARRGLESDC